MGTTKYQAGRWSRRLPELLPVFVGTSFEAVIALGSNLPCPQGGGPEANLEEALLRLAGLGNVLKVSSFHHTRPVGYLDQPDFVNAVATFSSGLGPVELLHALLELERGMGRTRDGVPAKGPRLIDLDLIFFDGVTLETEELTLPHPEVAARWFVLGPLAEIAPLWVHPVNGLTVNQMLDALGPK